MGGKEAPISMDPRAALKASSGCMASAGGMSCCSRSSTPNNFVTAARLEMEVDAERFEDAAAYRMLERVVAEEAEVTRPAPRRDARPHVAEQAARRARCQRVEHRQGGRLELALSGAGTGQAAQTVEGAENDLGRGGLGE